MRKARLGTQNRHATNHLLDEQMSENLHRWDAAGTLAIHSLANVNQTVLNTFYIEIFWNILVSPLGVCKILHGVIKFMFCELEMCPQHGTGGELLCFFYPTVRLLILISGLTGSRFTKNTSIWGCLCGIIWIKLVVWENPSWPFHG